MVFDFNLYPIENKPSEEKDPTYLKGNQQHDTDIHSVSITSGVGIKLRMMEHG